MPLEFEPKLPVIKGDSIPIVTKTQCKSRNYKNLWQFKSKKCIHTQDSQDHGAVPAKCEWEGYDLVPVLYSPEFLHLWR